MGFWNGDKLARLLVSLNINFNFNEIDNIDKTVQLNSWYDRENLLFNTLNPQNMFLNRLNSSKSNNFIKSDPYVDKVLENKMTFYDEYLKAIEKFFNKNFNYANYQNNRLEYLKNKTIKVENITPTLLELFKHYKRYNMFHKYMISVLKFDINGFEKCKLFKRKKYIQMISN